MRGTTNDNTLRALPTLLVTVTSKSHVTTPVASSRSFSPFLTCSYLLVNFTFDPAFSSFDGHRLTTAAIAHWLIALALDIILLSSKTIKNERRNATLASGPSHSLNESSLESNPLVLHADNVHASRHLKFSSTSFQYGDQAKSSPIDAIPRAVTCLSVTASVQLRILAGLLRNNGIWRF